MSDLSDWCRAIVRQTDPMKWTSLHCILYMQVQQMDDFNLNHELLSAPTDSSAKCKTCGSSIHRWILSGWQQVMQQLLPNRSLMRIPRWASPWWIVIVVVEVQMLCAIFFVVPFVAEHQTLNHNTIIRGQAWVPSSRFRVKNLVAFPFHNNIITGFDVVISRGFYCDIPW